VRDSPLSPTSVLPQSNSALGGDARKKVTNKSNTWYPADDEKKHFLRKRNVAKPAKESKTLTPGKVLILLAGKFRGKRVVLLSKLPSGLLLVAGPHKVNGVPLKRVNAAYVLATSQSVPLAGVNVAAINDDYFKKVLPKGKRAEGSFKTGKREVQQSLMQFTEDQKKEQTARAEKNKATQKTIDTALLGNIKKVPFLRKYLSSRFTLYNNTKPHELVY
jgi:large subunit ribosomal protein L6e